MKWPVGIGGAVSYKSWRYTQVTMITWKSGFLSWEILEVKIEPTNRHDIHAVAIYRDAEIVGYCSL